MTRADIAYLHRRLTEALKRPLTSPGSEVLAYQVLGHFEGSDVLSAFAEKALETLRDGERHDRVVVSADEPRLAILFVAWNGTHLEVQSDRFGKYFTEFANIARMLVDRVMIAGILMIDAYLRDNSDPQHPEQPMDEGFEVDVEYSYLPGFAIGSTAEITGPLSQIFLVNAALCSPEEKDALQRIIGPR